MTIQLRAYDHGRDEPFRAISSRFFKLCGALGAVVTDLSTWRGKLGTDSVDIISERDADGVVVAAARMWRSGDRELVAYGPSARADVKGIAAAKLSMVAGMAPLELPVWVPNQIEIELTGAAEAEMLRDPPRLQAALQALVTAALPAWAVVSIDGDPRAPVPPFANGAPSVGWMTYLSSAYPPVPSALPQPSVAYEVGPGIIVVAHPKRPDAGAIERLAYALADAKVLLPASHVKPPR